MLLLVVTAISKIALEFGQYLPCRNKLKINTDASSHSILPYSQLSHGCLKTAEIVVLKKFTLVPRPNDKVMDESSKPVCKD